MPADQPIETDVHSAGEIWSVAATHPGSRRPDNEDAWLNRPDLGLWAVADGAGGHARGEVASRAIVDALDAIPAGLSAAEMLAQVRLRLEGTHHTLAEASQREGLGIVASTVVALILREGHFAFLWIGDSRGYLLRDGALQQMTVDHSLVQDLVSSGKIDAAEAETHPQANVITRAVGAIGTPPSADKRIGLALPGDRFLLCSDGVSKTLPAEELARWLSQGADAERLVAEALRRMVGDNVTAVVVEIGSEANGGAPLKHDPLKLTPA